MARIGAGRTAEKWREDQARRETGATEGKRPLSAMSSIRSIPSILSIPSTFFPPGVVSIRCLHSIVADCGIIPGRAKSFRAVASWAGELVTSVHASGEADHVFWMRGV